MDGVPSWTWSYDGWVMLGGVLCAVAASLPGNFLVLRRMSLLGDAVAHAVLPGLAMAFWMTHSRSGLPVYLGAVTTGLITAMLTQWIRDVGKVDEGASIGVAFTTLFAAGLVLMSQAAPAVDLDPGCVLYGILEASPLDTVEFAGLEVPRIVITLSLVLFINLTFVVLMFKELLISSFDPGLATTEGCSAQLMHYLLMIIVAITTVASFEATGNILVVAMLIVPPSIALLLTDRLSRMIMISGAAAALSAILGDAAAVTVPRWFGFRSTSSAGMMTVSAGVLFLLAGLFAPSHGLVSVWLRRQRLALRILAEDCIALMYRMDERGDEGPAQTEFLARRLLSSTLPTWLVLQRQRVRCWVAAERAGYRLTATGRQAASAVVRSHRLWETYLVNEGVDAGVIHRQAEVLEHFTGRALREKLQAEGPTSERDPHGSVIPDEDPGAAGS